MNRDKPIIFFSRKMSKNLFAIFGHTKSNASITLAFQDARIYIEFALEVSAKNRKERRNPGHTGEGCDCDSSKNRNNLSYGN